MGFACVMQPHLLEVESLEQIVASWIDQEVTTENWHVLSVSKNTEKFNRLGWSMGVE